MRLLKKRKSKAKYPKLEPLFAALIAKVRIKIKLVAAFSVITKTAQ